MISTTGVAGTQAPPADPVHTDLAGSAIDEERSRAGQHLKARAATRVLGALTLVGSVATVWLGMWVTPPDVHLHQLVRLVYVHPPIAWVALFLATGVAVGSSCLWLWPRTRAPFWDHLAAAAVEVDIVFTGLTLITGSIWGRPTWGVWWAWDARLTSTALLLVLLLGYAALRRVPGDADSRARRCAIGALVAAVDVPIVHFSVEWWTTLHQQATVLSPDGSAQIHGISAWTLLIGFLTATAAFVWMLIVRYQVESMSAGLEGVREQMALEDRRQEAALVTGATGRDTPDVSRGKVEAKQGVTEAGQGTAGGGSAQVRVEGGPRS